MSHRLRILEGPRAGEVLTLQDGESIAGREPDCDLYLPSRRVSRKHCSFTLTNGRCIARDLGSANGMLINGHTMEACELISGTHLQMGDALMVYEDGPVETARPLSDDPSDPTMESMGQPSGFAVMGSSPTALGFGPPMGGFGSGPPPAAYPEPPATEPYQEPAHEPVYEPVASSEPPAFAESSPSAEPMPFGALPAGGFGAPGPGPSFGAGVHISEGSAPVAPESAPNGGFFYTKTPFMFRVVALFAFLGLVLFCGPGGGFLSLGMAGSEGLEAMSIERGVALAESLGNRNAESLSKRGLDYELGMAERLPEVGLAYILDAKGSVVAPINLAAKTLSDDPLYLSAKKERREAVQPGDNGMTRILVPITGAPAPDAPKSTVLGYAYLEYNAKLAANTVARPMTRVGISLLLLLFTLAAGVGGVWALADRPLAKLRDEAELAIKGHSPNLISPVKWHSLEALAHTMNRALARAAGMPDPSPAPEPVVERVVERVVEADGRLPTMFSACTFPVVLLDAQGCVSDANDWGQHLLGQSVEGLRGQPLVALVSPPARERLELLWQGISTGQEPVLADSIDFGEGPRTCTLAAGPGLSHAVLVIQ